MRVIILGAAGRDFHNFNMVYRGDPSSVVVAFTAAQISGIADRTYPPALAGPLEPGSWPPAPAAAAPAARLLRTAARAEAAAPRVGWSRAPLARPAPGAIA